MSLSTIQRKIVCFILSLIFKCLSYVNLALRRILAVVDGCYDLKMKYEPPLSSGSNDAPAPYLERERLRLWRWRVGLGEEEDEEEERELEEPEAEELEPLDDPELEPELLLELELTNGKKEVSST